MSRTGAPAVAGPTHRAVDEKGQVPGRVDRSLGRHDRGPGRRDLGPMPMHARRVAAVAEEQDVARRQAGFLGCLARRVQHGATGDEGLCTRVGELARQLADRIRWVCGRGDAAGPVQAEVDDGRVDVVGRVQGQHVALGPAERVLQALAKGDGGGLDLRKGPRALRVAVDEEGCQRVSLPRRLLVRGYHRLWSSGYSRGWCSMNMVQTSTGGSWTSCHGEEMGILAAADAPGRSEETRCCTRDSRGGLCQSGKSASRIHGRGSRDGDEERLKGGREHYIDVSLENGSRYVFSSSREMDGMAEGRIRARLGDRAYSPSATEPEPRRSPLIAIYVFVHTVHIQHTSICPGHPLPVGVACLRPAQAAGHCCNPRPRHGGRRYGAHTGTQLPVSRLK